jgi:hypothetical protein
MLWRYSGTSCDGVGSLPAAQGQSRASIRCDDVPNDVNLWTLHATGLWGTTTRGDDWRKRGPKFWLSPIFHPKGTRKRLCLLSSLRVGGREKAKSLTQLRATKQLREPLTQAEKDFNRNWEQQENQC